MKKNIYLIIIIITGIILRLYLANGTYNNDIKNANIYGHLYKRCNCSPDDIDAIFNFIDTWQF